MSDQIIFFWNSIEISIGDGDKKPRLLWSLNCIIPMQMQILFWVINKQMLCKYWKNCSAVILHFLDSDQFIILHVSNIESNCQREARRLKHELTLFNKRKPHKTNATNWIRFNVMKVNRLKNQVKCEKDITQNQIFWIENQSDVISNWERKN